MLGDLTEHGGWRLPWPVVTALLADLGRPLPYPLAQARPATSETPAATVPADADEAVHLLTRAPRTITVTGVLRDGSLLAARLGADEDRAVRATAHPWGLRLDLTRPDSLVPAALALLPPARPGRGHGHPRFPADRPERPLRYLRPVRPPRYPADDARAITELPRHNAGVLSTHTRRGGGPELDTGTLCWFDTPRGRFAATASRAADDRRWLSYFPADPATLRLFLTCHLA